MPSNRLWSIRHQRRRCAYGCNHGDDDLASLLLFIAQVPVYSVDDSLLKALVPATIIAANLLETAPEPLLIMLTLKDLMTSHRPESSADFAQSLGRAGDGANHWIGSAFTIRQRDKPRTPTHADPVVGTANSVRYRSWSLINLKHSLVRAYRCRITTTPYLRPEVEVDVHGETDSR